MNLHPVEGREQGRQRPVLVLSIDGINRLPLVVTVVIGTKGANVTRDYPTNIRLKPEETGLDIETIFLGFRIRSLDLKRFPDKPSGKVSGTTLIKAEDVVRYCLGL